MGHGQKVSDTENGGETAAGDEGAARWRNRIVGSGTEGAGRPRLYVDLSPHEERLVLATLDPIGALAGVDAGRLEDLLAQAAVDDTDLRALLDSLAADLPRPAFTDPDVVPPPPDEPYVQAGELWRLGKHRLPCGDATNVADVARFLDGARPALTVTDPPYGVSYDPGHRPGARRLGLVANDDRADWRDASSGNDAFLGAVAGSCPSTSYGPRPGFGWLSPPNKRRSRPRGRPRCW